MTGSIVLAAVVVGAFWLGAWGVWHFGRRAGQSAAKIHLLTAGFVIAGALGGWYAWEVDSAMRRQTLFEVMAQGSEGVAVGVDAPVRDLAFFVEHPGVEHELLVAPDGDPTGPVDIHVQLIAPNGKKLIDEKRTFEVRAGSRNSRASWDAWYTGFTPTITGEYHLTLALLHVGIPRVHVRVGDPLKTDGHRIPGY